MSTPRPSNYPTAAQALEAIASWDDAPVSRRKALATAIRTYCRVGGKKPPELVRLDPFRSLREFDAASAASLDISASTLANARAGLRFVLRRLGLLAPVRKRQPVQDARWAGLIARLPARFHPHRLRAFLEYCAAMGVAPEEVTDETLAAYLAHRIASHGGDSNRSDVREVARQWAKAASTLEGWPRIQLTLPLSDDCNRALPFASYPESLQVQVEAFCAWCGRPTGDALFGDDAEEGAGTGSGSSRLRAPLSPATIETRRKGLRLLLWAMVETGDPVATINDLRLLLRKDVLKRVFPWHRQRLGGKVTGTLATMADALATLAVHLGLGQAERDALRTLLRSARPKRQKEITERNAQLLDRFGDELIRAKLIHLPSVLMQLARREREGWTARDGTNHPPRPMEACWTASLAAAIEIELTMPLRLHDLAHLKLGETLQITQDGRQRPVAQLRLAANKTGVVVETIFDRESAELLREYMQDFRPLGPNPETAWMFPNRDAADRPRAKGGFSSAIIDVIEKHTGMRATVQSFRCFAAALILESDPNAIEDVRAVLGQSGYEIALRHYRRVNRLAAGARISASLSNQRRKTRLTATATRFQITHLASKRRRN